MGRGVAILMAGALLLGGATAGCGDDSPSQEELRDAREQGAQAARLRELERELRQQERKQSSGGGAPVAPASPSPAPSGGRTSCGGDLSVGPNTSCPFAESVRSAYPGSDTAFSVYSSVTGRTYTMRCTTGSPHVCTGGNNASVYFP
jgi:hypothetical protein